MDREIKRLLKLSRIPNFKMLKSEEETLKKWKEAQEPVKITAPKRKYVRKKKTTNEVKEEEKETGDMEIVNVPTIWISEES